MISFENVNKFDPVYQFFNWFFRLEHNYIYYSKIQVIGYEHVPPKGYPIFAISNHQNAVMDPLALLYMYKDHRQPVYIARGDVFKKNDFIARLLRFLKILPTFRSRDGGVQDVKSNLDTFDLAARFLNEGATLTMYPEAGHQAGKFFNTFKKGFPRVAFRAAERSDYQLDFMILPIYIYYTDYFNMQAKQVIVIGEPFHIDEFYELYRHEPNKAFIAMNEKCREAVRRMGVDVTDHEHYAQYDMIFTACRSKVLATPHAFDDMDVAGTPEEKSPRNPYANLLSDKKLVDIIDGIKENNPGRFAKLMEAATEYREGLQKLRLRDWEFDRKISLPRLVCQLLVLCLTAPFALFGMICNIVPFKAVELLKKDLKDPMFKSTLNFVPGIVFFPLWYIIMYVIVCIFTNWWFALIFLVVALAMFLPFFHWKKSFIKWASMCRFHRYETSHNSLFVRVKELRSVLRSAVD